MAVQTENRLSINRDKTFQKLINDVLNRRVQPENEYEIAAYLESEGWNDGRVAEVFGVENVFELALELWVAIEARVLATPLESLEKKSFIYYLINSVSSFLRGLIFALPMAISVLSMLTLRFSLWSYQNLTTELATSIAIGTILSFLVVGGFTQSIARRGFLYLSMGYYNMGRRITFVFLKIGFVLCLLISLFMVLANAVFEIFPMQMIWYVTTFFLFLSGIWLSVTIMYILKKEVVFTGLIAFGIALVYLLFRVLGLDIILAQLISLFVVSVLSILLVIHFFKTMEARMEKGINPLLPRTSITLYSVMPYFLYGFLYFSMLYADRVIAWSSNNDNYMPYLIWFRGHYELGLDFALLMLMIPMGIVEVVVNSLMSDIEVSQKMYMGNDTQSMNARFSRYYYRSLFYLSVVSVISALVVYFGVYYIDNHYGVLLQISVFTNPTSHFVFIIALAAYALLVIALMNALILFSLSQPSFVNRAIAYGLSVNIIVGFALSRWMSWWVDQAGHTAPFGIDGYSYAIIGLLAGSIVFLVLTFRGVQKVLGNLDYYLYAAA